MNIKNIDNKNQMTLPPFPVTAMQESFRSASAFIFSIVIFTPRLYPIPGAYVSFYSFLGLGEGCLTCIFFVDGGSSSRMRTELGVVILFSLFFLCGQDRFMSILPFLVQIYGCSEQQSKFDQYVDN
jgi:hypothetical protein